MQILFVRSWWKPVVSSSRYLFGRQLNFLYYSFWLRLAEHIPLMHLQSRSSILNTLDYTLSPSLSVLKKLDFFSVSMPIYLVGGSHCILGPPQILKPPQYNMVTLVYQGEREGLLNVKIKKVKHQILKICCQQSKMFVNTIFFLF